MTDPALIRLIEGVRAFRQHVYPQRRDLYEQVMLEGQNPHTLFITCADSRIDPGALTQSQPGDLFVARNIGNLVPTYGDMLGGVSAVIEYAVSALKVRLVVVCGHADCGAMKGLLEPELVEPMPAVKSWLRNAADALAAVQAREPAESKAKAINDLIEANVLLQLQHLKTHPAVAAGLSLGTLAISGWVYDIATGRVRIHDSREGGFVPVNG